MSVRSHRLSPHLLGRHVTGRAEDEPGARKARAMAARDESRGADRSARSRSRGSSRAVVRQEDVLRLDVPVDDAARVRGREPVCDLARDLGGARRSEGPRAQPVGEVLSLEELGDRVRRPRCRPCRGWRGCSDGSARRRARLAVEPGQGFRVVRRGLGQDLEGDLATQRPSRAGRLRPSASTERSEDLVGPSRSPGDKAKRGEEYR